jgi:hypothetical protein
MNINATLFVQAIHFFIAYLILRFLVFKPSLQSINQEHESHDALRLAIVRTKEHLMAQDQERQNSWSRCYQFCKEQQPMIISLDQDIVKRILPQVRLPILSEATRDRIVEQVSAHIIQKLERP